MLQSRIDRFVKRMPEDKIEFMGYIWPANLIQPDYNFNILRHPTIMQCLEHVIGVDLSSYYDGPPKSKIHPMLLYPHISHITGKAALSTCTSTLTGQAEPVSGYTRDAREQEFLEFNDLAFQIYDDIVMAICSGALADRKDNTVQRTEFLNWLRLYIEPDRAQNKNIADVNLFIVKVGGQVKEIYNKTVSKIKKNSGRNALSLLLEDMEGYYAENEQKFPDITKSDITAANGRFGGSQQARDVKGAILLNMVENCFPKITNKATFPTHWQGMWPYYTKLKNEYRK